MGLVHRFKKKKQPRWKISVCDCRHHFVADEKSWLKMNRSCRVFLYIQFRTLIKPNIQFWCNYTSGWSKLARAGFSFSPLVTTAASSANRNQCTGWNIRLLWSWEGKSSSFYCSVLMYWINALNYALKRRGGWENQLEEHQGKQKRQEWDGNWCDKANVSG